MDPELLFKLLIVAEGYVPVYSGKFIDPRAGSVLFRLQAHDLDRLDPNLVFRGRVLGRSGKPMEKALVTPFGFRRGRGDRFGGLKEFDPLAVTNAEGEFRLRIAQERDELYVRVNAPNLAPQNFGPLPVASKVQDVQLGPGVEISGQVLKGGRPLAGITLGLVGQNRDPATFVGDFKIATDEQGRFLFRNVPPEEKYALYGVMESCRVHGAIPVRYLQVAGHATSLDVGPLTVQAGHRLTGRVVLADGKPVPADTRVLLSRTEAWDYQIATAAVDGSFAFAGLPAERYSLSVRVPNYHPSPKNGSYDLLSGYRLLGMIQADCDGLQFLLEPGHPPPFDEKRFQRAEHDENQRRLDRPLQGAPAVPPSKLKRADAPAEKPSP